MSHCCGSHSEHKKSKKKKANTEKIPKSFVGKYLYNLGKKDMEKEKHSGKHEGDCC